MGNDHTKTSKRKDEHISICLQEDVQADGISNGLEQWRFKHNPLPNIDFQDIDLPTMIFNKKVATPLLISSMTGGTELASRINQQLAIAAEERGWSLALGSMRAAIENEELAYSFQMRKFAPTIPIIANVGLVQLNYGVTNDQCLRLVELSEADALVFHMNSMQEVFQPEGDTNFADLLRKLETVIKETDIPIGVKEVGWGIDGETAKALQNIGVQFIDVAGAGGTSWSQVERYRTSSKIQYAAASSFADWGLSTADSIREVSAEASECLILGSGGLHTGVDAAKAIALGAHVAGFGRTLLQYAVQSIDDQSLSIPQLMSPKELSLLQHMEKIEYELKVAMFGIGAETITQLKKHDRLIRQ
ncbi:MAG: type 2 isopentenyl-diphosphate Delta-isomerase [Candidatus Pristimantibacillus lignocellulolyticus]|uniref:Isopentenyl-diphosphate delta-isomerase n=1 Tax=Candidatus Pristimantibacillus lignocellulolyticus TaxID=2994561 RepID=A0A9J6ZA68_9BACL|nr:MAG: type 2 isopentenyl-diphosphate Delta-isomerase [Candidatus Pristimantibacillus lignocellulolyticus]